MRYQIQTAVATPCSLWESGHWNGIKSDAPGVSLRPSSGCLRYCFIPAGSTAHAPSPVFTQSRWRLSLRPNSSRGRNSRAMLLSFTWNWFHWESCLLHPFRPVDMSTHYTAACYQSSEYKYWHPLMSFIGTFY